MARAGWLSLLALSACRQPAPLTVTAAQEPSACSYDIQIRSEEPLLLDVAARCTGKISGFSLAKEQASFIELAPTASASSSGRAASARYRVDLERAAREHDRFDVAERVGHSLIAPASSFLILPEPLDVGIPVTVTVHAPASDHFSSGLIHDSGSRYRLQAHEIPVATYCVFGSYTSETLQLGASTLEIATLDGPLATSAAERRLWIETDARAVADFYGTFPARAGLLAVIPLARHQAVDFGKLLPASAPGVALVVGSGAKRSALYDDWILVHELFHIGFPSFEDEGKWLDEGSATYFEPIIRARVGQLSERDVWRQFITQMPQGFDALTRTGLEQTSFRGIYWGGALACLMVDVAARRGGSEQGLQGAFRALLAQGGNASTVWSLEHVVRVLDQALGGHFLADFVARYAKHGSPLDADALFRELGVRAEGDVVTLDDSAPLANIRRAIVQAAR